MKAENARKALLYSNESIDGLAIGHRWYKECLDELSELERIATEYEANKHYIELGKAVDKLFEDYAWVETIGEDFKNTEELLEWAEGRE